MRLWESSVKAYRDHLVRLGVRLGGCVCCVAQLTCHVILFLASPIIGCFVCGGVWCGVTIRPVFVHDTCGTLCARYPSRKMPIWFWSIGYINPPPQPHVYRSNTVNKQSKLKHGRHWIPDWCLCHHVRYNFFHVNTYTYMHTYGIHPF